MTARMVDADPNCPLCTAWTAATHGHGGVFDALDAHQFLVLGWWLATSERTTAGRRVDLPASLASLIIRGMCSTHQRQLEFLSKARNEGEMAKALSESKR